MSDNKPAVEAYDPWVLPEIYDACAHPQSVWFECHWRPVFDRLKLAYDDVVKSREHWRTECMKNEFAAEERDALKSQLEELYQKRQQEIGDLQRELAEARDKLESTKLAAFEYMDQLEKKHAELVAARAKIERQEAYIDSLTT